MKIPFGKYKGQEFQILTYNKDYTKWIWYNCRITIHKYPDFENWLDDYFGFSDESPWTDEMETEYQAKISREEYERSESLTYVYLVINNYSDSKEVVDVYLDYDFMMKDTEWWRTSKLGHIRTAWYIEKREVKIK